MAKAAAVPCEAATSAEAFTQSSQVASFPGRATPACSNKVLLAKPPVRVSCVMKPVIASLPSSRIQSAWAPKLVRQ